MTQPNASQEFDQFLSQALTNSDVRYELKTYLTKPINRAALYPLLLEVLKEFQLEFPGIDSIQIAVAV